MARCPRCRSLLDAMAGLGPVQDEAAAASLTDAVLAGQGETVTRIGRVAKGEGVIYKGRLL